MNEDRFIQHLRSLPALARHDSGKLAAYRRACGQRLAESKDCQDFAAISTRGSDFLTVTLAAQYPSDKIQTGRHHEHSPSKGSIGAAWADYCKRRKPEDDPHAFYQRRQKALADGQPLANIPSIHERFRTVLDAELERDGTGELAHRLRGLVRMLAAEGVPIDVIQLAYDLRGWRHESRYVQERWAKAFYGPPRGGHAAEEEIEQPQEPEEQEEQEDAD